MPFLSGAGGGGPVVIGEFKLLVDTAPPLIFGPGGILPQGIPQTFRHLRLTSMGRSNAPANSQDNFRLQFNGDTAANYDSMFMEWFSDGVAANNADNRIAAGTPGMMSGFANSGPPNNIRLGNYPAALAALANGASYVETDIPYYANTFFNKCAKSYTHHGGQGQEGAAEAANTGPRNLYYTGRWLNVAAINRIDIIISIGTAFKAGSQFTLYGIN